MAMYTKGTCGSFVLCANTAQRRPSWQGFKLFVLVRTGLDGLGLPEDSHSVNTSESGQEHPSILLLN